MQIPKEKILELLRSRGQDDKAQQADQELPGQVDPQEHGATLQKLGVDPKELIGQVGGGDVAGKLGL